MDDAFGRDAINSLMDIARMVRSSQRSPPDEVAVGILCLVKDLCEKYPELTDPRHKTEVVDLAEGDSTNVYFQRIVDEVEKLSQLHLAGHVTTLEDVQKVLQVIWKAAQCAEINESPSIHDSDSTLRMPSTPFQSESLLETGHLASDVGLDRDLEAVAEWNEENELVTMMLRIRHQLVEYLTHAPILCCAAGHELRGPQLDVTCKLCKLSSSSNSGRIFLGCRLCEFDVCFNCHQEGAALPPECILFKKLKDVEDLLQSVGVLKHFLEPDELRLLDSMALTMVLRDDANQATWARDMREYGNQLVGKNKLNLAAKFLQRSLRITKTLPDSKARVLELLLDIGRLKMLQGDWQLALTSLQDSLDMQRQKSPISHSIALTLQYIGMVKLWQFQGAVAEVCLRLSLAIRKELSPPTDESDESMKLLEHGLVYWLKSPNLPEAEDALNKSLKIVLPYCNISGSLPSGLRSLNDFLKRTSHEEENVSNLAVYRHVADILHDFGAMKMGFFVDSHARDHARGLLQTSLNIKRFLGRPHVPDESLALTLNKLGMVKYQQSVISSGARKTELKAEACQLLEESRSIYEKPGAQQREAKKMLSMVLLDLSHARGDADFEAIEKSKEVWFSAGGSRWSWLVCACKSAI